jgi:hypothetical protein
VASFDAVLAAATDLGPLPPPRPLRLSLQLRLDSAREAAERASFQAMYDPA